MFAPSNAAFTAALLSGQLWRQLQALSGPAAADGAANDAGAADGAGDGTAAAMQRLITDHIAPGRLLLADLQAGGLVCGSGACAKEQLSCFVWFGGSAAPFPACRKLLPAGYTCL